MPDAVEMRQLFFVESFEGKFLEQAIEDLAMQLVDVGPALLAAHHAVHRRAVARAPGVGERRPIGFDSLARAEQLAFADDRRAPVDYCAEDVEYEGFDHGVPIFSTASPARYRRAASAGRCRP